MTTLLLTLCLLAELPATKDAPKVSSDEQIQLLKLQVDELAAKNAALEAQIRRIDGVNKLLDGWNKRGCVVESNPQSGLLQCKAPEVKKDK